MKTFAQEIGQQTSFSRIGPLVQLAINLSAAANETVLIAGAASTRIVIEKVELVAAAAGTFALWSGSVAAGTRMTGDIAAPANGELVFQDLFTQVAAHGVILNRTTSFALAGTILYRVLSNPA
jgi:hypothetical protein